MTAATLERPAALDQPAESEATASDGTITVARAYRVVLDPTPDDLAHLARHAGAARWTYNLALSAKIVSRRIWEERVRVLIEEFGFTSEQARAAVKVKTPNANVIDKARVRVRGTDRYGHPCAPDWDGARAIMVDSEIDPEVADAVLAHWRERCEDPDHGIAPWLSEVTNGAAQRAERDADAAWQGWMDWHTGRRAGPRVGFPRFKSKASGRGSFYLTNTEAGLVPGSYRHVRLGGRIGEVRVHPGSGRLLRRAAKKVRQGKARVMAVTVSREGHRWYASVLCQENVHTPRPTRRMQAGGTIGVHLGVRARAVLSNGEVIDNPMVKVSNERRMVKASRALSRSGWVTGEDGVRRASARRRKARERVARLAHQEALRRAGFSHALSARLARDYDKVGVLDIGVKDLTRAPERTRPRLRGWDANAKREANRKLLDVAPFTLRTQVAYKSAWRGGEVVVIERGTPIARTCSGCGTVKPKRRLPEQEFHCTDCGLRLPRGVNAARVLQRLADAPQVASDAGETLNARGGDVRPSAASGGRRRSPAKREGPPSGGSPLGGNAGASPKG